jgi:hypothetical protein
LPDEEFREDLTPDEVFNAYLENNIALLRDLYDSKTISKLRIEALDKLKKFIIDGKDVILSNLSDGFDLEYYREMSNLLLLLVNMQESYYYDGSLKVMEEGILSAIEFIYGMYIFFLLGTRAKGKERERLLVANPQHIMNRFIMEQNKPSALDKLVGKGKNPEQY